MGSLKEQNLRDIEVAITGRLASMSRVEAIKMIADAGGRYVRAPLPTTEIVVVGNDGPLIGRDGFPTQSLRRAESLRGSGIDLDIIDEDAFLRLVGVPDRKTEVDRLYTISQLSRILGATSAEIRSWIRADLMHPVKIVKRLCYFEFKQLACARRLHQLTQSGISPNRLRKSLEKLTGWLPGAEPALSQLEVIESGGPLMVRLDDGRLADPNGQLHLDFDNRDEAEAETAPPPTLTPRKHTAEDWFNIGILAEEEGNHDGAIEAYQRALSLGEPQPEVCFNLGNTLYALDRSAEAAACFIRATEIDPEYVEAWNNLGNTLAEIGRPEEAIPAYKRALSIEPSYADAHYNLGETLAVLKDRHGAVRHWLAYLRQDPNSQWAHHVRKRLTELN